MIQIKTLKAHGPFSARRAKGRIFKKESKIMSLNKEKLENLEIELETLDISLTVIYKRFQQCLNLKEIEEVKKITRAITDNLYPNDVTITAMIMILKSLTETYLEIIHKEKTKDV